MKSKIKFGLLTLYVVLVLSAPVQAVSIPLGDSGWAMVVSPRMEGVSVPIVDRVTSDAVYIELGKTFTSPLEDGLFRPIIIEFQKISSTATSNIIICDEYIVNDTSTEWLDFHMSLIVKVINPEAGFNRNFIPDGDQLENVYYSSGYGYGGRPIMLNFIDTDGSGVPSLPAGDDVFCPGYRSGQIVIVTDPDMVLGARFGLKEVPTIPEPATLVSLGTAGIWIFTRKKRRFLRGYRSK